MCIKCEAMKAVAAKFGAEIQEIEVGTVAPEFLKELEVIKAAEKKLDAQIETATNAAAEKLEAQFKESMEGLETLRKAAWKDALASAGIDIEKQAADYGINRKTGVVTITKIVSAKDQAAEVAPGVH